MKNTNLINKRNLEILKSNTFSHNNTVYIPTFKKYVPGQSLTVNNLKSIAKMIMLEEEKLEETLLTFFTKGEVDLESITELDKIAILSQVVLNNTLDPLEISKACFSCKELLTAPFSNETIDVETWKVPEKIVKHNKDGIEIEFKLGTPSIADLSLDDKISARTNINCFIKGITVNGEEIEDLSDNNKNVFLNMISHDALDINHILDLEKESIDIPLAKRCHSCGEINKFDINKEFIVNEIVIYFFSNTFQQIVEDEVFLSINSNNALNSMGSLNYIDFCLYVNKVQGAIVAEANYKRDQVNKGNNIIS